jgi:hypothetical protein
MKWLRRLLGDREIESMASTKSENKGGEPSCWNGIGDGLNETWFMKTPGGYLILHVDNSGAGESMCFVPDPTHSWALKDKA